MTDTTGFNTEPHDTKHKMSDGRIIELGWYRRRAEDDGNLFKIPDGYEICRHGPCKYIRLMEDQDHD